MIIYSSNNPQDIKVVCGEWDIDSQIESKPKQERTVASISVHPQFNKRQFYHDVALLHLEEDFVLDLHLDVACLPHSPIDGSDNFIPSGCVVTGWGDRAELEASDRKDSAQPIMKAVRNLPIVGHDECQQGFRDQVDQRFRLHDSFICAGGERGVDACTGDGGGPLVCPGRFTKRTDVEPR